MAFDAFIEIQQMRTTSFLNQVGAAAAAAAVTSMLLVVAAGCNLASYQKQQLPPLGELRTLEPGISFTEVTLLRGKEEGSKLWIYQPSPAPTAKLPCIVIAPAGTPLSYGIKLQQGDRREHTPYVRAGFAVIAYEIDGAFDPHSAPDIRTAIKDFRTADAGVANAKVAIDYALRRVGVDSNRLFVAGHSSAATLALQVAARDKRVRGVIAYAPVTDVAKHLEGDLRNLDVLVPGTSKFLQEYSPLNHVESLRCPVFLFHSNRDGTVPVQQTIAFARELRRVNPKVTVSTIPEGDHYGSMVEAGIPRAIASLREAN